MMLTANGQHSPQLDVGASDGKGNLDGHQEDPLQGPQHVHYFLGLLWWNKRIMQSMILNTVSESVHIEA